MLSHATPSTMPPGKNPDLEYSFYNYILKIESFYPGALAQMGETAKDDEADSAPTKDNNPHENKPTHYTIQDRLFFNTLEISNEENQEKFQLTPLANEITTIMAEKDYRFLFKGLYKSIETLEPSLTLKAMDQVIAIQDAFIKKLLTPDYIKQINTLLSILIPEEATREKTKKTIYNAIFFRCLAHVFTLKLSSSKKTHQRGFRQKFLTEIYTLENDDPNNTLITMTRNTKEKIVSLLETNNLKDILEGKVKSSRKTTENNPDTQEESAETEEKTTETQLAIQIKKLSIVADTIKIRYEFMLSPSLTITHLLSHFYALARHLQKKPPSLVDDEVKSLAATLITFIDSHISIIKADSKSLLKTETLIKAVKDIAIAEEYQALEKLQSHLKPTLQKIKLSMDTPKQTRPPLPTTASVALLGHFKKTKEQTDSSTKRRILTPKNH